MPFTFAHPALVLPLINRKRFFSATGLITGSICPDFESFVRFNVHKLYSHTWPGMFWFDLPVGILLTFIFHNAVRDQLIRNLPDAIEQKFMRFIGFNWSQFFRKHIAVVIFSILTGITSHLLWDAITRINWTHSNGHNRAMVILNVYVHIFLQLGSSLAGLGIVAWYIIRMPSSLYGRKEVKCGKIKYWTIVVLIAGMELAIAAMFTAKPITAVLYIDIGISGILLGIVLASLYERVNTTVKAKNN